MKTKKRNGFFTFIFSFLPGGVEMYMGYMKSGLSIMALFFLFILPLVTGIATFLGMVAVVIWFFAFFHAWNYAGFGEEELTSVPDRYIWDELLGEGAVRTDAHKLMKYVAYFLIFVGIAALWDTVSGLCYRLIPDVLWEDISPVVSSVPKIAFAILFIVIGVRLIAGKKKELEKEETDGNNESA